MSHEELDIGPSPAMEDAVQTTEPDYHRLARIQSKAFIEAIRKVCGPEPEGARLKITSNPHDFTSYLSVAIRFDPEIPEAVEYAMKVERESPETWEAAGMVDPLKPVTQGKRYVGVRTSDGCVVTVSDGERSYPLNPRVDLRNHSPDGFNWSYSGSGPAQLSLALLADALGDDDRAREIYQDFKRKVVARIEGDQFDLSQDQIRATVAELEAGKGWSR